VSDFSWEASRILEYVRDTALFIQRPSFALKPRVFPDGNMWCALYGENLQEGVAGFGETPEAAACDFDNNWWGQKLNIPPRPTAPTGVAESR